MQAQKQLAEEKVNNFLEDMKNDYTKCGVGSTKLITEKMLDEFVDEYVDLCVEEIRSVKNSKAYLNPLKKFKKGFK